MKRMPITKVVAPSNRGAAPGERRGGRQAGTPNKATAEVKTLARAYGADIIDLLWLLARTAENEGAQIAACKELLERGYGKTTMLIGGDPDAAAIQVDQIRRIIVHPPKRA